MQANVDYRSGALIGGLFILIIGIILIAFGWSAAVWVSGILIILAGILAVVGVIDTDKTSGIVEIVLGILLLVICKTGIIDNFVGIIVGIIIILIGLLILVTARLAENKTNLALAVIVGILLIAAGLVLVYYNTASGDLTAKIVGIILVIAGIVDVAKGIKG